MRIAEIMTREVRDIAPQRSIRDAARLMDELNVGVLPVCDEGRLVGVVTDRDITVRATASGAAPDETPVFTVMTSSPRCCHADDDVADAVNLMATLQVRRVPVLDDHERLVGIVALGDLAEDHVEDAAKVLEDVSTPAEPDLTAAASRRVSDNTFRAGSDPLTPEQRMALLRAYTEH
jgi:CBS domain-containing protein